MVVCRDIAARLGRGWFVRSAGLRPTWRSRRGHAAPGPRPCRTPAASQSAAFVRATFRAVVIDGEVLFVLGRLERPTACLAGRRPRYLQSVDHLGGAGMAVYAAAQVRVQTLQAALDAPAGDIAPSKCNQGTIAGMCEWSRPTR